MHDWFNNIGKFFLLVEFHWEVSDSTSSFLKTPKCENHDPGELLFVPLPPITVSRICSLPVSNALANTQEGGPANFWRSAPKTFCRKLYVKLNTCDGIGTNKKSFKGQQSKYKLNIFLMLKL